MCSVNDTGDIEDLSNSVPISKLKIKTHANSCNKCKENKPHILLRNKDAYCKDCFLASTTHKFRALLGKHRLIKDNDRVLIIHTGGHPTTSLLHFLKTGLEADTPKKIRYTPICLFVENQSNMPRNDELIMLKSVSEEAEKFNIPLYFTSLRNFCQIENGSSNICIYKNIEDFLNNLDSQISIDSKLSETAYSDLERIYERRLWISVAKELNCKFIFSPEISTNIASQILTDVALGRGSQIPSTTGFCDARDEVIILRPLRVFDMKELALYNYFHNLDPVILKEKLPKTSAQNLIKTFISELQLDYPATVTTILKTGEKLCMASNKSMHDGICSICQSPIGAITKNLSASRAVAFSCNISRLKDSNGIEEEETKKNICFSCSKIEEFFL